MLSLRPIKKAAATLSLAVGLTLVSTASPGPWRATTGAQSPEITIELSTNGNDADSSPGPTLTPGDSVIWHYLITVNGPTTMFDVIVSDSGNVSPNCDIDGDGGLDGTHIHPGPLEPGQSFTCSASGSVQASGGATFTSTATVWAFDFEGATRFEDQDKTHHTPRQQLIANPNVTIQSLVNGAEGDSSPGPYIAEGSDITWSYVVTNTGNVPLSAITVTTSDGVAVDCGGGSNVAPGTLAPGRAMTCSANTAAAVFEAGLQSTTGSVDATAVDPDSGGPIRQLSAQDPHNYTPVRLPGALAFTGPSQVVAAVGTAVAAVGLGLWAAGATLARRRREDTAATAPAS